MIKILAVIWTDDIYRRIMHLMGSLVVIGTYATSLYFLSEEAPELWKGNPFVLLFRVLITVVIGAPFALIGAGPYIFGSFATADTKSPLIFLLVLSIIFVFDIWFRIEVIFFPLHQHRSLLFLLSQFIYLCLYCYYGVGYIYSREDIDSEAKYKRTITTGSTTDRD